MEEKETANYKITGLVDIFDEQGQITGQYPVGSIQELDVDKGIAAVEAGQAEAVGSEEIGTDIDEGAEQDADIDADEDATGETGEASETENL